MSIATAVDMVLDSLVLVGSLGSLVAVACAWKLSRETRNERYFVAFVAAALSWSIHAWVKIPWELGLFGLDEAFHFISELGEIVGVLTLAYATYGLSRSMMAIRRKMQEGEKALKT